MRLNIIVRDEAKETVFCKIDLIPSDASTFGERITVYCNGQHEFDLLPGEYGVEIYKGNLYVPIKDTVRMERQDVLLEFRLKKLVDTKSLGLYSFDAHSHVSRNENTSFANLEYASTVMKGEDFNFFFAGSPYDRETHIQEQNQSYDETNVTWPESLTGKE